jgi:uroporphyrinogen decarboxylase
LRILREALGPDTPILQTIFNPLAQAKNLAGEATLITHLRKYPDALKQGLNAITGATLLFIKEAISTGIDGIFFAVQHAQATLLSKDEFNEFGKPFDLSLLEVASDLWLNMVHVHGTEIYFDSITSEYPMQILNWHDRDTKPSLDEASRQFDGIICGGLRRESIVYSTPDQIHAEAIDAKKLTKGKKFILATGCVTPIIAPHGNTVAVRRALEEL